MNMPKLRFKADDGADFTEWESMLLGDLVYIQRGGSPRPIAKYLTTGYGINWIKIGDAPEFGHYITATKDKIIPAGKAKSREVHPGDLILSNSMSYGYPYILKIDGCIHDGWLLLRERNRPFDKVFLCEYLGSKSVQCQYERLAAGSAAKNLNIDLVSNVIIDLPSLQEQRKIADLLLAVDEVIEKQQAEIEAWEQYKKGLTQKLFSQEVRFKADDGSAFPDWESVRIGDLGCFIGGLTFKASDTIDSAGLAVLTATNIGSDGSLNYKSEVQFVDKKAKPHQYLMPNDIVICKSNGSQHLVGKAAKYDGGYSGPNGITVGAFCGIFRSPCPIIPFWFQSDDYKDLIKNFRQGEKGSLSNIKGGDIENYYTTLPTSQEEQRKIVECLGAIDDVIALSKAELEKWRELKKGLLQQLFV